MIMTDKDAEDLHNQIKEMQEVKRKIIETDFSAFSDRIYEDCRSR